MQLDEETALDPLEGPVDWLLVEGPEAARLEESSFDAFVEASLGDLLRFAAVAGPEPDSAPALVRSALAAAYRRWRDISDGDERPVTEVAGILARRIARARAHDLAPNALALEDRLAAALHGVLDLDEREVAHALRIPELHAVARLARADARIAELLGAPYATEADPRRRETARVVAARARRRGRAYLCTAAGTTAAALALLASSVGVGWPGGAPAPAAPISAGAPHAYRDGDVLAALGATCASFPPEQHGRPVFDGPPLPYSVLLSARDVTGLGGLRTTGRPHRAILPVYVAEDEDPVLPADQQSGLYGQLASSTVTVQQTVIRYAGGTGGAAAREFAAELRCRDDWHDLTTLEWRDAFGVTTRVYAKQLLSTPPPVTVTWDAVVRAGDVVSVLHVRGQLGARNTPAVAHRITAALLKRLARADEA